MAKKNPGAAELREMFYNNVRYLRRCLKSYKSNKWIVGIDPSLTATSVAWSKHKKKTIGFTTSPEGCRNTSFPNFKRIAINRQYVIDALKAHPSRLAVIEGYSYASMQNRELMGEVGGMVRLNGFYDHPELVGPVLVVSPTQLKKYILGTGAGGGGAGAKEKIMMNVLKNFHLTPENNNEADAIVLCKIGKDLVKYILNHGKKIPRDDRQLRDYLKDAWEELKIPKYRWEVLVGLIQKRCDEKVLEFWNDTQTEIEIPA